MIDLNQEFEERLQEIEAYLQLLDSLEQQLQGGIPQLGENGDTITVKQQRILYSSVYLQLYNLIESTITQCVDSISHTVKNHSIQVSDLSLELRKEWVKNTAKTHENLNYENRLQSTLNLCEQIIQATPISEFDIDLEGGGSWNDEAIYKLTQRLGLSFQLSREVKIRIKRPFLHGQGALELIRVLRNKLAHGNISFVECGEGVTVGDLRDLTNRIADYLREVITCFQAAIADQVFLLPDRRSRGGRP